MHKLGLGIVVLLLVSSIAFAIQTGYTSETRYTVSPGPTVARDIVFSSNRYGQSYFWPYGGFGAKSASRGSFGMKGAEEGASVLATNAYIPRGRDPTKISNYYASARGYHIVDEYVELGTADLTLISRPQINGTPNGYARVISIAGADSPIPGGTVYLRTRNLPPLAPEYLYEAWLVDEDSGYSMSMGLFQPAGIGRVTSLDYEVITPLWPFDSIMVTVEPFPDMNPSPGPIVVIGSLKNGVRSV